jgi:DNA polymerase III sliding clamp (beta) subunit (PCNA family)
MSLLAALQFVKGAVARKGFAPELTHFEIKGGFIKGFNGDLCLVSPIDLDIEAMPSAVTFIKAIAACKAETAMSLTNAGRLSIKSGKFKAFVACLPEGEFPEVDVTADRIALTGDLIQHLKVVLPFIAEDASKPWARGVLLDGCTATATNNVVIVQKWMPSKFPMRMNIPIGAVKELVRIKEEPIEMAVTERSITFFYEDGRWLQSALMTTDWPDIDRVLDQESTQIKLPPELFENLELLKPFLEEGNQVYMENGTISTSRDDTVGARFELEDCPEQCCLNHKHLLKLDKVADTIDFSMYPAPIMFYGDNLRGVIIGMIMQ